MSSFQDPISIDHLKHLTNSSGMYMYETSSFQDLLSRPQTESIGTHNATRYESNGSFQDLLSRPLHMIRTPNNEKSLVVLDHELAEMTQLLEQLTEAPQEDITTEFETPFKTLHINRI